MNWSGTITEWLIIILTVVNGGLTVSSWYIRKMLVTKEEHAALVKRVDTLEHQTDAAPGWVVLNDIRDRLGRLDGSVNVIGERVENLKEMEGINRVRLERIETHLLESGH